MKLSLIKMLVVAVCVMVAAMAHAADIAGVWTKTTHPDPNNIILLYRESQTIKAIGYERVAERPAYWHGEGRIRNGSIELSYHYSGDATPFGWEPNGRMTLHLSGDGNTLQGKAVSDSGDWSDRMELRRVTFILQP